MSHCLPQRQISSPWSAFITGLQQLFRDFRTGWTRTPRTLAGSSYPPLSPHLRRDIGLPAEDERHFRDAKIWNDPVNVELRRIW